ncbi:MAG: sigma-70 family RNA polymerase sigma factor, partial [Thermocrispum sp.]
MTTAATGGGEQRGESDAELITAVRNGTISAYGTLYERHVAAAYNLARQLARSAAEADDLVAEAFSKVLDTLRAGKGPDAAFRAYLLTALRHTAYDKTRKDKRVDLNEDMSDVKGALGSALTVPFSDTAVAGLERTMAARAFARLPERWQAVLWHTEIEQQSPAEVAPLLGLTPNGVSALAYRAREGLRQAYLQVHLAETTAARCRATADRLGAWTRDGLSKRERTQVETHLDECDTCRALAAELADVNGAIRAIVGPLVLGGAALGYLALAGAAKGSAVTAGASAAAG